MYDLKNNFHFMKHGTPGSLSFYFKKLNKVYCISFKSYSLTSKQKKHAISGKLKTIKFLIYIRI